MDDESEIENVQRDEGKQLLVGMEKMNFGQKSLIRQKSRIK